MSPRHIVFALGSLAAISLAASTARAEESALDSFNREAEPILDEYCYNCHGDGSKKGGSSWTTSRPTPTCGTMPYGCG